MRSLEGLFQEAVCDIKIPNAQPKSLQEDHKAILTSKTRTHVFYDETVPFYLHIVLPDDVSITQEDTTRQVKEFFQSLEIQVEASMVDSLSLIQTTAQPTPGNRPSGSRPHSVSISNAHPGDKRMSSPGIHGSGRQGQPSFADQAILHTYTYNSTEQGKEMFVAPVNGVWTAIVPLAVPISFVRTKSANTMLMLSTNISLRPMDKMTPKSEPIDDRYNVECFSMINLLEGLGDDPQFASISAPQHHFRLDTPRQRAQPAPMAPVLRRTVRRTIAVRSALNVKMRTTRVSPTENPLMMSIEVENNSEHGAKFKVVSLDVDVANAVVTPLDPSGLTTLPMTLHSVDQVTFLFSISLLEVPDWSSANTGILGPNAPLGPHHRQSSENFVPLGAGQDLQRQVTIVLEGTPEVEGVSTRTIQSRWNCLLNVSGQTRQDHAMSAAAAAAAASIGGGGNQGAGGHHSAGQGNQRNSTLQYYNTSNSQPGSPNPQSATHRGSTLTRRVSTASSPNAASNRYSVGSNAIPDVGGNSGSRPRRTSVAHSVASDTASQRGGGSASGGNRRSGMGSQWGGGVGRGEHHGLAPVQESSGFRSPGLSGGNGGGSIVGSDSVDSYEGEGAMEQRNGGGGNNNGGGRIGSPMTGLGLDMSTNPMAQGRVDSGDGIVVSFAVTSRVVVGKIFNLEIFIVNRSRHIRRFTIVVPNRKRAKGDPSQGFKTLPPLPSGEPGVATNMLPIDPYMEEPELLRRHVDNETSEADIICLENNVRLSPLYPLTCQNLSLRFIAIKEQLHTIDLVQMVDNDTGFVTNLRNCLVFLAEASFGALSEQIPVPIPVSVA